MRDEELPKAIKILFWPVLTPSRSFWEMEVRLSAVLLAGGSVVMLVVSLLVQVEIYFS